MKYIHIRIIELLEEKGISKNRICKDLDGYVKTWICLAATLSRHQKSLKITKTSCHGL